MYKGTLREYEDSYRYLGKIDKVIGMMIDIGLTAKLVSSARSI